MVDKKSNMSQQEIASIVKTLRYLAKNNSISEEKGKELTGGFWSFVKSALKQYNCFTLAYGGIEIVLHSEFEYTLSKFEELSKTIEKEEEENKIAVGANLSTTKSYWVSLVSLIISIISMCISIYTMIYE